MSNPRPASGGPSFFTDIPSAENELTISVGHFESTLDLSGLARLYPDNQVQSVDPLIVQLTASAYVVMLRFGTVLFWNCPLNLVTDVLTTSREFIGNREISWMPDDYVKVRVGQDSDRVNFHDIQLEKLTIEHIKLLSEIFGQSCALSLCEKRVLPALANGEPVINELKTRGKLNSGGRELKMLVGMAMAIRLQILSELSLFDPPPETWKSERLANLHLQLYDHLDIARRISALQEKLSFISDLNLMLLNLLQARGSHYLEWTVVILIVVEVVLGLIGYFGGKGH